MNDKGKQRSQKYLPFINLMENYQSQRGNKTEEQKWRFVEFSFILTLSNFKYFLYFRLYLTNIKFFGQHIPYYVTISK